MKVYQINSVCGVGSTGNIALNIKKELEKKGHLCRIGYGRGAFDAENCYKFGNSFGFVLHTLFSRITDRQGFYSKYSTNKLIKDIKKFSPDLIQLHNIHGYFLNIKMLFNFLKEYNKPVIWTLHDCWAFTGHCAHFDYIGCTKWKTECYNCPQKNEYPASLLLDNSKQNFLDKKNIFSSLEKLYIVTPSHWLGSKVKESFLGKYPITTIYNGVDLDVFKPTESNFKEKYGLSNKKMLLSVSSLWNEKKGFNDLLYLAKILPQEYKLVIVGLEKSQIKKSPNNVLGLEKTTSQKSLAEIYSAADIYLNLSYEETMGLTTVEALATGTPAIVYNRTSVPEIVDDDSGSLVKAGDFDMLLDTIIKADFKKENCLLRSKHFEKEKQFNKYIKLYLEVLG